MNTIQILPAIAAAAFIVYCLVARTREAGAGAASWALPASLSTLFLAFSLFAMASESLTGFWVEHTRTLWGNQIWFDLLLAIGIAWTFILPRARRLHMHTGAWLLVIVLSGCIGLLAMVARLHYLESRPAEITGAADALV